MIIAFLLAILLFIEVRNNNKYLKEIEDLYRLVIHQQQQINALESKSKTNGFL